VTVNPSQPLAGPYQYIQCYLIVFIFCIVCRFSLAGQFGAIFRFELFIKQITDICRLSLYILNITCQLTHFLMLCDSPMHNTLIDILLAPKPGDFGN
jgi:hypothetical protein